MSDEIRTLRRQLAEAQTIIAGSDRRAIQQGREIAELRLRASDVAGERAANAMLTAEVDRLRAQSQQDALQLLATSRQADENWQEVQRLSAALAQAVDALRMPCDRWSRQQSEIVSAAILVGERCLHHGTDNNGPHPMELFAEPRSTSMEANHDD